MELIRGTLDVLVLKTVSWGRLHGYGISRAIGAATADALLVEEGALYPALRRLEKRGLLRGSWGVTDTGREARFYELTPAGTRHLQREMETWRRYVDAMSRVLFAEQPAP